MAVQQTRIELPPNENDAYMNYTIWQPETKCKPWAVHVEGWRSSGVDVWIYHDQLKRGFYYYPHLKFKSAIHFCDFIRSQIVMMKKAFKQDIEIRGIDYKALNDGYQKGVSKPCNLYIATKTNERN